MNIHLTSYGKGIPLVFFHGWGFDSQIWMPLLPKLTDSYQVILVDLPGFGLSSMMDWATFKTMLLNLLPDQFALAGWSMGGLYATRFAIEAPGRVTSLLNIASSPQFVADELWPGVPKDVFIKFHHNLSFDLTATLNEFIALQANKKNYDFTPSKAPSKEALECGLNMLDSWDLREELQRLTQPTCYLFGRLDPITSVKTMQAMQLLYPQFKYILFKKSAHMPFLSQSDDFIDELLGFIQ